MTAKTKDQIKAFFETGDKPSESQFIDFIDSYVDKSGPIGDIETAASAGTVGFAYVSGMRGEVLSPANARAAMSITVYNTALAVAALTGSFLTTAQALSTLTATTAATTSGEATDVFVTPKTLQEKIATTAEAITGSSLVKLLNPKVAREQIKATESFATKLLHLQDQKSAGTNGGTATSGSWQTRTLNTEITDEITSTLASNEFTLPAGTYYIEAIAPATRCDQHQARLYNVTDAVAQIYGSNETTSATAATGSNSMISGRFTIADTKTFRIEHRVTTTRASTGFGEANSFGGTEIYTDVRVWKVA